MSCDEVRHGELNGKPVEPRDSITGSRSAICPIRTYRQDAGEA